MNKCLKIEEIFLIFLSIFLPLLFGLDARSFIFSLLFSLVCISILKILVYKHIGNGKVFSIIVLLQCFFYFMILWNYHTSITLGSADAPYIRGDAGTYFHIAKPLSLHSDFIYYAKNNININYIGYPIFLGIIFKIFYADLLVGLLFSMIVGLLNVFIVSYIVKIITNSGKTAYWGAFLAGLSPHLASTSTILLKDVFIINSLLLIVLAAIFMLQKRKIRSLFFSLLGFLIISFFRLPFLAIYVGIFVSFLFRKLTLKSIMISLLVFSIMVPVFIYSSQYSAFDYTENGAQLLNSQTELVASNWNTNGSNSVVGNLVFGYESWPTYKKVVFLPIFTLIQYLQPVNVWNFNHIYPWHYIDTNLNVIWLLFLGPLVIFSFLCYNRIDNILIKKLLLFGGIGFLFVAYIYGGTIPRYGFSFLSLMLIGSAYVYERIKSNVLKKMYVKYLKMCMFVGLVFFSAYLMYKVL